MTILDALSVALLAAGGYFFLAGTAGLLRFPDVYTRLHALTKVDNLGLGFVILGLMLRAEGGAAIAQLAVIWLLVLAASTTSAYLVARSARHHGIAPWVAPREEDP